jgi:hypothetical protein
MKTLSERLILPTVKGPVTWPSPTVAARSQVRPISPHSQGHLATNPELAYGMRRHESPEACRRRISGVPLVMLR